MTEKTKIEKAIDYIAKMGRARGPEIAEASGMPVDRVSAQLYIYVQSGVLVSCQVSRPGLRPCNEYRLAGHIPGDAWRDFKINVHSKKTERTYKPTMPPAHMPADRPAVSATNTGSTLVESTFPPATERAVTREKPHRKTAQPVPGAGGHVDQKADWNLRSDGGLIIENGFYSILLTKSEAIRLSAFLMVCDLELLKEHA